jgi:transcription initiation factor TFIID subunit 6
LAIEGVQPIIPQNPSPNDIKNLPPAVRGATSSILGNDILNMSNNSTEKGINNLANGSKNKKVTDKDTEVKPLVRHLLSKELKLYFDKVVEVLLSTDPEKEPLQNAALNSLKNDPGLHQLEPYFIQFVAEQITNQLRNIDILTTMLLVISALVDNKTIFLDPYVHALMPCILTLLLAKNIGVNIKDLNDESAQDELKRQLAVREFAAILLKHIISSYGSSYSTLKPRVTRTLLRALLDSSKPIGTQYGALLGLKNMGDEVIKLVLLGNLKMWYTSVVEQMSNEFGREILVSAVLDCLEVLKVKSDLDLMETEVDEEKKKLLEERIGEPLASRVLQLSDANDIVKGIFFGEASV